MVKVKPGHAHGASPLLWLAQRTRKDTVRQSLATPESMFRETEKQAADYVLGTRRWGVQGCPHQTRWPRESSLAWEQIQGQMNQGDTKGKSILDRGNIKLSLEWGARSQSGCMGMGRERVRVMRQGVPGPGTRGLPIRMTQYGACDPRGIRGSLWSLWVHPVARGPWSFGPSVCMWREQQLQGDHLEDTWPRGGHRRGSLQALRRESAQCSLCFLRRLQAQEGADSRGHPCCGAGVAHVLPEPWGRSPQAPAVLGQRQVPRPAGDTGLFLILTVSC